MKWLTDKIANCSFCCCCCFMEDKRPFFFAESRICFAFSCLNLTYLVTIKVKTDWNKQQTSSNISKQLKSVNPAKSNIIIRTIKNPRIYTRTVPSSVHVCSSLALEKEKQAVDFYLIKHNFNKYTEYIHNTRKIIKVKSFYWMSNLFIVSLARFAKIVTFLLDVWQGSEYASSICKNFWVKNCRQIHRFLQECFWVDFVTFFLKLYLIFKKIKIVVLRCWFIQDIKYKSLLFTGNLLL